MSEPQNNDSQDGTDTPVAEWFGQNVDSDAELADDLVAEHGEEKAEDLFDDESKGADVEDARRGDTIDPELGEAAYRDGDVDHAAAADGE